MEITLAIRYIHPTLNNNDFMVMDDNNGKWPYIKWYNKEIKQPTQAELTTAWDQVLLIQKATEDKLFKKEAINKIATLSDQLNALMEFNYAIVNFISKTSPDILEVPTIKQWLQLREEIKAILVK